MEEHLKVEHPYLPSTLRLPHYAANDLTTLDILAMFFSIVVVVCAITWYLASKRAHTNCALIKLKLCWFASCAGIHFILEGYFALYHRTIAGEMSFLAQVWKEYAKGDSRYMSDDVFTVCMESMTAWVDGPLAFLALLAFLQNKPYRHLVQITLSLCQLYGDVLYFSTAYMEGFKHGPYNHPLYFWFYFFFMNILWIIIPSICIVESWIKLTAAQAIQDMSKNKKS